MQVLVATRESQGVRDRDVRRGCHEGEPVLAVLDEGADVEDRSATEERRASWEFDRPGRLRPARPAARS